MDETLPTDLKFETALAALEQIVHDMETGELPLEDSISAYRRGAALLKHCQQQLVNAEQQLRILEEDESENTPPAPQESP